MPRHTRTTSRTTRIYLLATVIVYYSKRYLLSYQDKKWFGRDIASFRQMNEKSIRLWIKMTNKLISNNKRQQSTAKQNTITNYFHQLISTPQPNPTTDIRFNLNLSINPIVNNDSFILKYSTPATLRAVSNTAIRLTPIDDSIRISHNTDSDRDINLTTNNRGILTFNTYSRN